MTARAPAVTLELAQAVVTVRRRRLERLRAADPWRATARPSQLPPEGDWTTWFLMAGRGFGKTRTGAEWVRETVMRAGRGFIVHLVGPTAADVRDVMVEGPAGILAACERYAFPARYLPSKRKIQFGNGAIALCFSADEPERLRGPQCHAAWADEVGAWTYPAAWDNLQFGLRLLWRDQQPRQVVTSTPKPVTIVREILALPGVVVTRGTTYENAANLAQSFLDTIAKKYENTRLGRQELLGELLEEVEGALWSHAMIDRARVSERPASLRRIVVAIDPATTYGDGSDETAICAAGIDQAGDCYVLATWHGRVPPDDWARRACLICHRLEADAIVAESNQGGEMVRSTIRHAWERLAREGAVTGLQPPLRLIHAKRGKVIRAEDVALLYEQGRVHHVGAHPGFEDQLVLFPVATELDDRVDALVHAIRELAGVRDRTLRAA